MEGDLSLAIGQNPLNINPLCIENDHALDAI